MPCDHRRAGMPRVPPLRYGRPDRPPAAPAQPETMTERTDPARLETLPPAAARPTRGIPLGSRYVLEHPIGEGSTGRVWQGVRRVDGSAVAIKVLHAEYAV